MKIKHKAEKHEVVEEANEEKPISKTETEPWNPEHAHDSPRRRGLLGLTRSKKGFEVRWVRYDSVDRRKAQGYVLASAEDFDATPDENGMIRRNELVLMVVPKEEYDARRKAVQAQTDQQSKSAKREFLNEREVASRKSGHTLAIRDEDREEE